MGWHELTHASLFHFYKLLICKLYQLASQFYHLLDSFSWISLSV